MKTNLSEAERFEKCFWLAIKCNRKLKKMVLAKGFTNEEEEIEFFREVKLRFACLIEFFVIASEASWYISSNGSGLGIFWEEELERYARFYRKHHSFIGYYESGKHD